MLVGIINYSIFSLLSGIFQSCREFHLSAILQSTRKFSYREFSKFPGLFWNIPLRKSLPVPYRGDNNPRCHRDGPTIREFQYFRDFSDIGKGRDQSPRVLTKAKTG